MYTVWIALVCLVVFAANSSLQLVYGPGPAWFPLLFTFSLEDSTGTSVAYFFLMLPFFDAAHTVSLTARLCDTPLGLFTSLLTIQFADLLLSSPAPTVVRFPPRPSASSSCRTHSTGQVELLGTAGGLGTDRVAASSLLPHIHVQPVPHRRERRGWQWSVFRDDEVGGFSAYQLLLSIPVSVGMRKCSFHVGGETMFVSRFMRALDEGGRR